jgi:hypothetical protein
MARVFKKERTVYKTEAEVTNERIRARTRIVLPPVDNTEQNILAELMVSYVKDNPTFQLEDFPISLNMAPSKFYKLAEVNEYFAHALNLARNIIASRIQLQWRERKIDREYAIRMLPLYHDQYYDFMMMKLKKDAEGKEAARLTVQVNEIPSSPLVPERHETRDDSKTE